jgi:hypothetical protein
MPYIRGLPRTTPSGERCQEHSDDATSTVRESPLLSSGVMAFHGNLPPLLGVRPTKAGDFTPTACIALRTDSTKDYTSPKPAPAPNRLRRQITSKWKSNRSAKFIGTVYRREHFDDDTSFGTGYQRRAIFEDRLQKVLDL